MNLSQTPKPDAIRRNARVGPLVLPAEGRKGPAPSWPLDPAQGPGEVARESRIWASLWSTPQAVAWERLGVPPDVVARYVRILRGAQQLSKDCMSEARQFEDRLGLNPRAMRTLMWTIASDEVAERRDTRLGLASERMEAAG